MPSRPCGPGLFNCQFRLRPGKLPAHHRGGWAELPLGAELAVSFPPGPFRRAPARRAAAGSLARPAGRRRGPTGFSFWPDYGPASIRPRERGPGRQAAARGPSGPEGRWRGQAGPVGPVHLFTGAPRMRRWPRPGPWSSPGGARPRGTIDRRQFHRRVLDAGSPADVGASSRGFFRAGAKWGGPMPRLDGAGLGTRYGLTGPGGVSSFRPVLPAWEKRHRQRAVAQAAGLPPGPANRRGITGDAAPKPLGGTVVFPPEARNYQRGTETLATRAPAGKYYPPHLRNPGRSRITTDGPPARGLFRWVLVQPEGQRVSAAFTRVDERPTSFAARVTRLPAGPHSRSGPAAWRQAGGSGPPRLDLEIRGDRDSLIPIARHQAAKAFETLALANDENPGEA